MLSVVKGIEPNDQVEAMLAAQMAAVHMTTMTFARRLVQVEILQLAHGGGPHALQSAMRWVLKMAG